MHCLVLAKNKQWKHWNTRRNGKCWQLETLDFRPHCHSLSQTIWQGRNLKLLPLRTLFLFLTLRSQQLGTELLPSGHPQRSPLLQLWVGACCMRCPRGHSLGQGCLKKPRPRPQQGNSDSRGRPSKVTLVCVQGSPHLQEDPPGATLICLKMPPASSHPSMYEPRKKKKQKKTGQLGHIPDLKIYHVCRHGTAEKMYFRSSLFPVEFSSQPLRNFSMQNPLGFNTS